MRHLFLYSFTLAMALSCANSAAAELIHNDFSDGTTQGWSKGSPTVPLKVETEAGGNKYLHLKTADSKSEDNDKKVAFHTKPGPWKGNYNAKGAKSISARFKNLGATPLEMHVAYTTTLANLAARYVVIKGAVIPSDKQWHQASFSLEDADVQLVDKPGHGGSDLSLPPKLVKNYVTQIRFSNGKLGEKYGTGHGDDIYRGWNDGPEVDAELGIDDITLSTDSTGSGTTHVHN